MTTKIYIAGPMTGYENYNYPAFYAAEDYLKILGYECVNPARLSEPYGFDKEWDFYLRNAIKGLVDCEEIALIDGWSKSKGALLELMIAESLDMKVVYLSEC